jgi:hypothetical protein
MGRTFLDLSVVHEGEGHDNGQREDHPNEGGE